jgi:hypothetical protein
MVVILEMLILIFWIFFAFFLGVWAVKNMSDE